MNFANYTTLEIIEEFADFNKLISSEEQLSELFDNDVIESVVSYYGTDDIVAINEAFNNWTDGLCKNGDIHEEQYKNYEYVGKYA